MMKGGIALLIIFEIVCWFTILLASLILFIPFYLIKEGIKLHIQFKRAEQKMKNYIERR